MKYYETHFSLNELFHMCCVGDVGKSADSDAGEMATLLAAARLCLFDACACDILPWCRFGLYHGLTMLLK